MQNSSDHGNGMFTVQEARTLRARFINLVLERDELAEELEAHRLVLAELQDLRMFLADDPAPFAAAVMSNGHLTTARDHAQADAAGAHPSGDMDTLSVQSDDSPADDLQGEYVDAAAAPRPETAADHLQGATAVASGADMPDAMPDPEPPETAGSLAADCHDELSTDGESSSVRTPTVVADADTTHARGGVGSPAGIQPRGENSRTDRAQRSAEAAMASSTRLVFVETAFSRVVSADVARSLGARTRRHVWHSSTRLRCFDSSCGRLIHCPLYFQICTTQGTNNAHDPRLPSGRLSHHV